MSEKATRKPHYLCIDTYKLTLLVSPSRKFIFVIEHKKCISELGERERTKILLLLLSIFPPFPSNHIKSASKKSSLFWSIGLKVKSDTRIMIDKRVKNLTNNTHIKEISLSIYICCSAFEGEKGDSMLHWKLK